MEEIIQKDINFFKFHDKEKIFVIKEILCVGAGYVGTLSMTIFAYQYPGIKISIFDKNQELIKKWQNAKLDSLPIVEPSFTNYFEQVINKNLFFISELNTDLEEFDMIYICVNTPSSCSYKISLSDSVNGITKLSNDINKGIQISTENV